MVKIVTSVGYPAAGKSVVADWMEENGIPVVSMGNRLRARYNDVDESELEEMFGSTNKSSLLGKWATKQRENHGSDVVAKWTCEYIKNNVDNDVVFVDGMRSKPELERFEQSFDDVNVILIEAKKEIRLERIRERGREGESDFTIEDLEERDEREESWGLSKVTDEADYTIYNNDSLEYFETRIQEVFDSVVDN